MLCKKKFVAGASMMTETVCFDKNTNICKGKFGDLG